MRMFALVALALTACFQPTYEQLACGPGGACPDGYSCVVDVCVRGGGDGGRDDDARSDDAAGDDASADDGGPPIDGSMIDASMIDASMIDAPLIDAPPTDAPIPICGNGTTEAGETCDDGNTITELECPYGPTVDCTYCNATCTQVLTFTARYCGNGVQESPEEACDGKIHNPAAHAPCCSNDCLIWTCG